MHAVIQSSLLSFLSLYTGTVSVRRTRKQYSDDTKRAVYAMLLEGSAGGRLPEGLSLQVSSAMGVSLRCVQRIWHEGRKGGGVHAVVNKRAKNCGRKRIDVLPDTVAAIPLGDRTTLEGLARGLRMSKSTVFRRLKEGRIERRSNAISSFFSPAGADDYVAAEDTLINQFPFGIRIRLQSG